MKKIESVITSTPRNKGMHSARNYLKCKKMIVENDYSKARLYHVVFHRYKGSTIYPVESDFKYAINALCEKLRDNNVPCEWKSAFEWEDEKGGLHMHVMLLVEAGAGGNPEYWLKHDVDGDSWLSETLKPKHVDFHVAPPKNVIHRTSLGKKYRYAYIPKEGAKLDDALVWVSYIFKNRGKENVAHLVSNIYGSSRPQRKITLPIARLQSVTEVELMSASEGENGASASSSPGPAYPAQGIDLARLNFRLQWQSGEQIGPIKTPIPDAPNVVVQRNTHLKRKHSNGSLLCRGESLLVGQLLYCLKPRHNRLVC